MWIEPQVSRLDSQNPNKFFSSGISQGLGFSRTAVIDDIAHTCGTAAMTMRVLTLDRL
jgi:hypothetical protein